MQTFQLGHIAIEVIKKDIKHIYLSVYPPTGTVRICAPHRTQPQAIRRFAISKLAWIKQQQKKLSAQPRESLKAYIDRESHYLWGQRYLLQIIEKNQPPRLALKHSRMVLQVRPGTGIDQRRSLIQSTYREQLRQALIPLIAKWEKLMAVQVTDFTIRKMKTKWGSCTPANQTLRFNLDLAKKPAEFLEYVVVHEMAHLLEPTHNQRFVALLDAYLPKWRFYRDELNRLPLSYEPGS